MAMHRRKVLKGLARRRRRPGRLKAPHVQAQAGPIRVGFLTVKTGPLASGGLQMEQGLLTFLKDRDNKLAGRPVELTTADTTGNPAVMPHQDAGAGRALQRVLRARAARRIRGAGDRRLHPLLAHADAGRRRRRGPDPAQGQSVVHAAGLDLRAAEPSDGRLRRQGPQAQARRHHRGRFRLSVTKTSRGFQRVFEDAGGKVVQKLWTPLNAPDYGTYISQLKPDLDALFTGARRLERPQDHPAAGASTASRARSRSSAATRRSMNCCSSRSARMGSAPITGNWYSAELDYPENKKFVELMRRDYKVDPGVYAAGTYLFGEVLEAAAKAVGRQGRGQGGLPEGDPRGEAAKLAARPDALRRIRQRGRQHLHPRGRRRSATSMSTPSSRPIRTSASSGPTTRTSS